MQRDYSDHLETVCTHIQYFWDKNGIHCHLWNVKYRNSLHQTVTVGVVYSVLWHTCKVIVYILLIVHIS